MVSKVKSAPYRPQHYFSVSILGTVPEGAVEMGCTADGEKLYMGRAIYGGAQTPGKLQSSHGCLYIPFGGAEVCLNEYEVLVSK